jgi:hypothetical protein
MFFVQSKEPIIVADCKHLKHYNTRTLALSLWAPLPHLEPEIPKKVRAPGFELWWVASSLDHPTIGLQANSQLLMETRNNDFILFEPVGERTCAPSMCYSGLNHSVLQLYWLLHPPSKIDKHILASQKSIFEHVWLVGVKKFHPVNVAWVLNKVYLQNPFTDECNFVQWI